MTASWEGVSAPAETPEAFEARRNAEIQHWMASKETFENAKNNEMDYRQKVTATCFPNPTKGTQRYELGRGYKLKLVYGWNYTLGDKDLIDPATNQKIPIATQVSALEDEIAALGNEGPYLAERLIRWKPELVAAEYEKLNMEYPIEKAVKELIDDILTVKPASPQLVFEEPKAK